MNQAAFATIDDLSGVLGGEGNGTPSTYDTIADTMQTVGEIEASAAGVIGAVGVAFPPAAVVAEPVAAGLGIVGGASWLAGTAMDYLPWSND